MDTVILNENERIDDLQCKGRKLIQNTEVFCFGMDAVLLANYAVVNKNDKCMDLCTGNGVIPILMEAKTSGQKYACVEVQKISAELARRNVELNKVSDRIEVIEANLNDLKGIYENATFNVVTVNPPYMNENHGIVNLSAPKAIARHEILCTLEDIIEKSAWLLKSSGRFYMVHRPARLVEIITLCKKYKLEPKRIQMIHPHKNKNANMVLIEAVKGGKSQLTVEPALVVYNEDGSYTKELLSIYNNE